ASDGGGLGRSCLVPGGVADTTRRSTLEGHHLATQTVPIALFSHEASLMWLPQRGFVAQNDATARVSASSDERQAQQLDALHQHAGPAIHARVGPLTSLSASCIHDQVRRPPASPQLRGEGLP